jgi:hypothetical protein
MFKKKDADRKSEELRRESKGLQTARCIRGAAAAIFILFKLRDDYIQKHHGRLEICSLPSTDGPTPSHLSSSSRIAPPKSLTLSWGSTESMPGDEFEVFNKSPHSAATVWGIARNWVSYRLSP